MKTEFWNFGEGDAAACDSIKNLVTVPKDLLEGENPFKVGICNIAFPAVTVLGIAPEAVGKLPDNLVLGDFSDLLDKGTNIKDALSGLRGDSILGKDLIKNLNIPAY